MGITLLISTIVGKVAGIFPDLFSEWKAGREHKREIELLNEQTKLQIELEEKRIQGKVAELDLEMQIAGMTAESKMLEAQTKLAKVSLTNKSGVKWIDGFNALLRPLFTVAIMTMFLYTAFVFVNGVMGDLTLTSVQKAQMIWDDSLIGVSIEAVIGFLYGYRSTTKKAGK